ncbi:GldL-related protein [Flavobacterium sp. RHBU_3]|uniref:GldL-related protein n=1 Tax=Flavobacterium sp. RHBU_3 TaxID=3391184 RepID=UPI003984B2AB
MKRTVNLLGFLASFTLSTGFMFKIMHWPIASILMLIGFALLNFGFLPTFFYQKYKESK